MQIATMVKNGKDKGSIIIFSLRESQELLNVFQKYCEQNKRQQYARKMKKEFDDNLECF